MAVIALLDARLKTENLEEARKTLVEILGETRAFPGCAKAEVLVDRADPSHVVVIETWESAEADAAYREWRRGEGARAELAEILAAPPALSHFESAALL